MPVRKLNCKTQPTRLSAAPRPARDRVLQLASFDRSLRPIRRRRERCTTSTHRDWGYRCRPNNARGAFSSGVRSRRGSSPHWESFCERAEEASGLPRFVVREVEEYLRCGLLEFGCIRVACERCGFERLVGFSCKRRGFCPSCVGRRRSNTALSLVEKVFPEVPVRQWVCSLPWRLRVHLGYDRKLCADVLEAFVRELSRSLKRRAKTALGLSTTKQALTGAVSVIQRGDSALRLNVHFHVLVLDGVYVRETEGGALVFHPLSAPTEEELADVAKRTALRVQKVLARHGRSLDGTSERDDAEPSGEQLSLSALCAAAASGQGLFGERAGKPLLRVVDPKRARSAERVGESQGINVHAEVVVPARDRARLERLCRYVCRPPRKKRRPTEDSAGRFATTMATLDRGRPQGPVTGAATGSAPSVAGAVGEPLPGGASTGVLRLPEIETT